MLLYGFSLAILSPLLMKPVDLGSLGEDVGPRMGRGTTGPHLTIMWISEIDYVTECVSCG